MTTSDPWIVKQKPDYQPVPAGMYYGVFAGVEDVALDAKDAKDDGSRWRFAWTVNTGPEAGKAANALVNRSIHESSHAGILIAGLIGRPIKPGDNVKVLVDECKGKSYMVSVAPGPKGGKPGVRSVGTPPAM